MRKLSLFWWCGASLLGTYLLLRFAVPYISMVMAGKSYPLPIPGVAMTMFMALAFLGVAAYVSYSAENARDFLAPLVAFLQGPAPDSAAYSFKKKCRLAGLILIPVAVGLLVYSQTAPALQSPTALRIQHPAVPRAFEKLSNPFRNPSDEAVKQFMTEAGLQGQSLDEGRRQLVEKFTEEGRILYQVNCRPCHGTKADGKGPMARGFRLRPIDFTDPGTIATLVEGYTFWRIKEGAPGLPGDATPWDSAMPAWKDELTDAEIWKIILAEYQIAGKEPRKPEKLE